jgi:hypothetical protein
LIYEPSAKPHALWPFRLSPHALRLYSDIIKSLHDFIYRDVIAHMAKDENFYPCRKLQGISKFLLQHRTFALKRILTSLLIIPRCKQRGIQI